MLIRKHTHPHAHTHTHHWLHTCTHTHTCMHTHTHTHTHTHAQHTNMHVPIHLYACTCMLVILTPAALIMASSFLLYWSIWFCLRSMMALRLRTSFSLRLMTAFLPAISLSSSSLTLFRRSTRAMVFTVSSVLRAMEFSTSAIWASCHIHTECMKRLKDPFLSYTYWMHKETEKSIPVIYILNA